METGNTNKIYFESQGYAMFGMTHENESCVTALYTKGEGSYLVLFHHKK